MCVLVVRIALALFVVQGISTNLIVTSFSDRIFIAVTQLNKLGSFTIAATAHLVRNSSTQGLGRWLQLADLTF